MCAPFIEIRELLRPRKGPDDKDQDILKHWSTNKTSKKSGANVEVDNKHFHATIEKMESDKIMKSVD